MLADTPQNERANVVEVTETKVEQFFVDERKHRFSQLSDHYGVSTTLRVNKYLFYFYKEYILIV